MLNDEMVVLHVSRNLIPILVKGLTDAGFREEADKLIIEALIEKKGFVSTKNCTSQSESSCYNGEGNG